jgi:hypothetical protein
MTAALKEHWNDEPPSTPSNTPPIVQAVIAVAVLLPLAALIVLSQRMPAPDSSIVLAGLTGVTPSPLCRADLRNSRLPAIDQEKIRMALNDRRQLAPN